MTRIIRRVRRVFNKPFDLIDKLIDPENYEQKRLRKFPRFKETVTTFFKWHIKIADAASFLYTKTEIFDQQIYKFSSSNSAPFIVDCGANIGLSIMYFKQLFPAAQIVAFEPDKKIFQILKYNMEACGFKDVTILNKGVWTEATTLNFYSEGADGGRIARQGDEIRINSIETTRLRDFLKRPVDFLKIDIEGSELPVIIDSKDLLQNVKNIFVEYHSFVGEQQRLDELLAILTTAGFRYAIQQHGIVSKQPFIRIENQSGMDILLNISGYRNNVMS